MRTIVVVALLGWATTASGQSSETFEIGPVLRVDRVLVEGGGSGVTAVGGLAFTTTTRFGIAAELTWAGNAIERSYDGWFISYAEGRNATREEIERLAPVARRTLRYEPGMGGAVAFVIRSAVGPRVGLAGQIGLSARKYTETSRYEVLSIPSGIDPARVANDLQPSLHTRTRGGLLVGMEVPVRVANRATVSPEFRFVYGGPARVGDKHRELGLGVRGAWRF